MYRLIEISTLSVEIKKSRFIVTCVPITSADMAMQKIAELKDPDATHNCWAWRVGETYRFSDDGEPGGSAGRPMLAAIDGQEYDGVLAHVIRYFGGIKLGVGGLVRAYGNSVAQCLKDAPKELIVAMTSLQFLVPFSDTYAVYGLMNQRKLLKENEEYRANGVEFSLTMRVDQIDEVRTALINATGARVQWIE